MGFINRMIADNARMHEGNMQWAYDTPKGHFKAGTHKCNQFNYDMIALASPPVLPLIAKTFFGYTYGYRYPTAGEWASKTAKIPGWDVVDTPGIGDVIAEAANYSDATGHCGIIVRERQTASASAKEGGKIVINDWGFRTNSNPTFRRYTAS